jgi:osmotically-inducible protein OsmY
MTKKSAFPTICSILFVIALMAPIVMLAYGCNTSQSPNRQVSDAQITAQIKSKLASDVSATSLTNIDVNTTNGVVTLAGQVENAEMKRSAETVAASVPGVLRVDNNLQVAPASASASH